MDKPPRVVVVDPYSTGRTLTERLTASGANVCALLSHPPPPIEYRGSASVSTLSVDLLIPATEDLETTLARVADWRPTHIVAGAESGVLTADRLASRLTPEVSNDPQTAWARRHKGHMVAAMRDAGLPTIATTTVASAEQALRWRARQRLAGDLVVKPPMSGGTEDVRLVRSAEEVSDGVARILGKRNVLGLVNSEVVVQERVSGPEYVVDTFTSGGRTYVTNVCLYGKRTSAGAFAVYESLSFLPRSEVPDDVPDTVCAALRSLGVRYGMAHTEVILTSEGPRVVEVGARPPGGSLPALTELGTGRSGVTLQVADVHGRPLPTEPYQLDFHLRSIFFIAPRSGILRSTQPYVQIAALPSCRLTQLGVREGDRIDRTTGLLSSFGLGWAILAHSDLAQVDRDHAALREIEQTVEVDPVP